MTVRFTSLLGTAAHPARRGRPPGSWARAMLPVVSALLLVTGLAGPAAAAPVPARPGPAKPLAMPPQKLVPVHAVPARKLALPVTHPQQLPAPSWPAAGSAVVAIPAGSRPGNGPLADRAFAAPGTLSRRAGTLPVWTGPPMRGSPGAPASAAMHLRVTVAPRSVAQAAGLAGIVLAVRPDTGSATGRVHVSVSYAAFADAYGGGYASRLRLVALPACAMTTPGVAACRKATPVGSANDVSSARVGADVMAPAILALTTSTSGSEGDFTATPLSESGHWTAGGQSGAFNYSYPVKVPPVPGGLEPDVALGYNSQAVDGLTSSTNNQASWIGDGWDYSPGYIERDYASCQTKPPDAPSAPTTGWVKSGDLCWSTNNVTTMSLNGVATTIIPGSAANTWRAVNDANDAIQYTTGTTNTTHDGDYWIITQPDGTKYYFGLNRLPGWATGNTETQSAWSAPVFSYHSTDPCFNATPANSFCNQAWRWNLDYAVDPHGNAIAYYYTPEGNFYARRNGTTGSSSYQRGGALKTIDYGLRAGAIYGVTPAGEVAFTASTTRTDVPTDLTCTSGAACTVISPTFWSKQALTTITTNALKGTTLGAVDKWDLTPSFPADPDPNERAPLWLSQIKRTGEDGGSVALQPVVFTGTYADNRVVTSTDNNPTVARQRMTQIVTETGGKVVIGYSPQNSCSATAGTFPAEDSNTGLCYPSYWTPSSTPVKSWFNKYVAISVSQQNGTVGGTVAVVTTYCYGGTGTPGTPACLTGGAWHYNDDTLTRSTQRTWNVWRGFHEVTTETGTAPDPVTETQDFYLQGMNGDHLSSGGTRSVSLTSTRGDTVTDSNQWAGLQFEHIAYNGAGSGTAGEVFDTVTLPWTSAATASQAQPSPLPTLNAYITGIAETKTFTPGLASGGTREADVTSTHDSIGRVTAESDVPDTSDASKDTCTRTTYPASTTAAILSLPYEVATVSVPCTATPSLPHDAVSDVQTFYDGSTTLGAVPTTGNATKAQQATSYSGSTPVFTVESTATFDQYGRKLTSTDADGRTTTTAYTPATGAEPTSVQVSTPTTQNGTTATTTAMSTTTTYDPARDLPLTVTDPASYVTTETYDALGRLTAVWKAGNATGGPANLKFSYQLPPTGPPMVTTQTINGSGTYMTSETFYDSLGRVLETQNQTASGNRTVSDVYYNSDGWKSLVSNPYVTGGAPSPSQLVQATDATVPSQTGYVYDGTGRVVRQITFQNASELWETDTTYGGDYTTVVPPSGGTPHTTFTDGRGLTTAIWQYHDGVTPGVTAPPSGYDKTTYTYTPARKLAGITDAANNAWSYQYNLAGDQTSATDPDTGTTVSTYDPAGQLMTTTNADSQQVSYVYDADGRKIASYDTTGGAGETSADQIAAWKYDTIKKGKLTSSSTFYGGFTYTKQVTGYNGFGLPIGTVTIIPTGSPLAGNYSQTLSYFSGSEQLAGYGDGPYGGLPAETVTLSYDAANEPNSLGSPAWNYVASLSYTDLGQPQEYTMGTTATPAWLQQTYDSQNRPHTSTFQAGLTPVTLDATTYSFDNSGNLTQQADLPPGGPAQVQCFQYDYLARLSQAWSQGTSGCSAGPSQPAESGAAAPYWDQYSYDVTGNLTGITSTPASGSATTIATQFPFTGTAHAPASQTVTPPGGGASTTTYAYFASGGMKTATGPAKNESLTWDAAGRLKSVTVTPSGGSATTTNYLYDADGQLLMQQATGGVTTLYLSDTEIVQNGTGATATGTRYYSLGGVTVAARSSAGSVAYLDGDLHGTSTLAVDVSSLAATHRYFDPYGSPAGAAPGSWIGMRAFVGGTADPGTGLTSLGLREYLPGLGEFISPDPLLVPYDPQNLNPYAYASDNPSTKSDPSGATDGPSSLEQQCAGNISYCLGTYYQQHGGYINYQGVPYTCCYHPGPDPGYSITIPAPKPILRPVLKKFTLGLLPNSFTALIDSPGSDTQITPVGDWGISININVPGDIGPEILITPPGYTGPLDIKDPPAEHGPSININVPGDWGNLVDKASFGTGKGPMHAVVTVIGPDGEIVSQQGVTSGGMTPEQAALGFPRSTLSTHVEAKSVDRIPLKEGQAMVIEADRRPCPSCRGAMNRTARETGATIIYTWGDNEWVAWPS